MVEQWKDTVWPALESKKDEFHLLGYDRATTEEIWKCITARLKRNKDELQLHQFVNQIMRLSANEYMNWLTISAYQGPDWFSENEILDLK
ncbi:post-transcriptional regulator [Pseudalkalibacillus caeni]|nr:post-transcriptional regulator [Pseudalkalibacillus caeni]